MYTQNNSVQKIFLIAKLEKNPNYWFLKVCEIEKGSLNKI